MRTFASIYHEWKHRHAEFIAKHGREGEEGPLVLAHVLEANGYLCPDCGRLLAAGAACPHADRLPEGVDVHPSC